MPGDKPLQEYLSVHIFQRLSIAKKISQVEYKIEGDAWVPVQY